MAKTSVIARERKREFLVKKYAAKRQQLKKIANNISLDPEECMKARRALEKLPRNSSRIRQRNRCRITGRPRGVYKKFGITRHKLREYAMKGEIPGLVKASW